MLNRPHAASLLDYTRVSENLDVELLAVMNVRRNNRWPRAAVSVTGSAAAQHTIVLG